jgi:hypothetical protein
LLDAPNTVDSLDDPTKDAARRPLESRNHGWDEQTYTNDSEEADAMMIDSYG